MGTGATFVLRTPVILLAGFDLAVLALRLRPWPEIVNLPGQGTTGFDPIICLVTYIGLLFWIGGNRNSDIQKALLAGTTFGIPAGLLAIGYVLLMGQHSNQIFYTQIGLLVAASILCGVAGLRGSQLAASPNVGIATGVWSAMVTALMASAVVLAKIDLNNPVPQSPDPWKQYQGLAIGNQAIQTLVHSLNTATGFMLIAPLVGGTAGLIFSLMGQSDKH